MSNRQSEVFCWPWAKLCLGLEEYLLNPELRQSATRSGGAQCEAQSLSCSTAPGSHCGGFTTHMIIALPGRGPVFPGPVSDTSYLWTCLGTTALLGGSSLGHWADQPWQLRVLGAEEQLRLAASATTTGCHWWCDLQPLPDRQLSVVVVSHPVTRPHVTYLFVTF